MMTINGGESKRRRLSTDNNLLSTAATPGGFNDAATADVILRLHFEHHLPSPSDQSSNSSTSTVDPSEVQIYLHSRVLCRSKYFAALLSDRWQQQGQYQSNSSQVYRFNLAVGASYGSFDHHLSVLEMLYSDDLPRINCVATAINVLLIALELLFEDCVKACVRYLVMVPWSEDEEERIRGLIPLLTCDEEAKELVARVSVTVPNAAIQPLENMIYGLLQFAMSDHQNVEFARPFAAKLLRDFASEEGDVVRKALDEEFHRRLKLVKDYVEEYVSGAASGDRRVETEATRTQPLQYTFINAEKLLWLVEMMVEFRGAESAIRAWCKPDSFRINVQRVFRDEALRHSVPLLPRLIMLCTVQLGRALVSGDVWAPRQLKLDFVQEWLFVLITCKQYNRSVGLNLTRELEEIFLKIISTLPLADAQHWLQMCLSFSTHNIEDCPHLTAAFKSWFLRAKKPPQPGLSL